MAVPYSDLKTLAEEHYEDAKQLYRRKRYNGSIYLIGYSLELALKAVICKLLNMSEYFATDPYTKLYYTHNLKVLLKLAGLEQELNIDPGLRASWDLVTDWDPEMRYQLVSRTEVQVNTKLTAFIKVFQWLKQKW